jgi:hypothetical protein
MIDGIPDDPTLSIHYTANGPLGVAAAEPFDNMQEYVTVHWIIRAKKGLTAMILSGHNHDDRYIRYDAAHPDLTLLNRSTFRNNSKTLGNGYDGDDTFRAKLTITGGAVIGDNGGSLLTVNSGASFGGGATFNGAFAVRRNEGIVQVNSNLSGYLRLNVVGQNFSPTSPIADILIENGPTAGSWNSIATSSGVLPTNAALKIRGGSVDRATLAIFNDNASGYPNDISSNGYSDGMLVSFYGHALTGTTVSPKFAGSVYASIDSKTGGVGTITRSIGLQIGNASNEALDAITFTKVDSGTVKTELPQSLPTATSTETASASTVILTSANELKKTLFGSSTYVSTPGYPNGNSGGYLNLGGILIQWGYTPVTDFGGSDSSGNRWKLLTFEKPFSDNNYSMSCTPDLDFNNFGQANGDKIGQTSEKTTTTVKLIWQGTANSSGFGPINGMSWIAIGKPG